MAILFLVSFLILIRIIILDHSYPNTDGACPKDVPIRYDNVVTSSSLRERDSTKEIFLNHIHGSPLGVLTLIVPYTISHLPCIVIFIPVLPCNSCIINIHNICSKYISIDFVYLIPNHFILHSLWFHPSPIMNRSP